MTSQGNSIRPASPDGFTVLPGGNFLINDYDGADGAPLYREYYGFEATPSQRGQRVDPGLTVDLDHSLGLKHASGVAVAPDGSLYFVTGILESGQTIQTIVHTDSAGNPLSTRRVGPAAIED